MRNFDELIEVIPQTYGEAIHLYPWIAEYPSHEWDNRTTIENAVYVIRHLTKKSSGRDTPVIINHPPVCTKCMKCHWPTVLAADLDVIPEIKMTKCPKCNKEFEPCYLCRGQYPHQRCVNDDMCHECFMIENSNGRLGITRKSRSSDGIIFKTR